MEWVKVSDRLPEKRPKAYFVKYGSADSHGTLHVDYFTKWGVTVWLDEGVRSNKTSLMISEHNPERSVATESDSSNGDDKQKADVNNSW